MKADNLFLLGNTIEKMQASNAMSSSNKKTNFLRNYSKPITTNTEAANMQIDVKQINVRSVQMNISKIKEKRDLVAANTSSLQNNVKDKTILDSFHKSGVA